MKKVLMIIVAIMTGIVVYFWIPDNGWRNMENNTQTPKQNQPGMKERGLAQDPIDEKIAKMNLDEKVGQLFIAGVEGTALSEAMLQKITRYHLGGIILFEPNLKEPEQALQLINDLKEVHTASNVPLFLSVDQEGGRVSRLPRSMPLKSAAEIGAAREVEFAFQNGQLLGRLLQAYGFHIDFAPVLDINSNSKNTVIGDRAFGSNVEIVSEMGIAVMEGMQEEGIITAIKHFPGHGDTLADSHVDLPVVEKSRKELEANEFVPFKEAIATGSDIVLVGHIVVPTLGSNFPATMSKEAVSILRADWGFAGVIMTDDLTMGAITNNYSMDEVTVKAIQAGIDILLVAHGEEPLGVGYAGVIAAVENGEISEERIDESVRRILQLKEKYNVDRTLINDIDIRALNKEIRDVYWK